MPSRRCSARCVQVRQRFVHQADRRLGHDRPAERHALLLPARQLRRLALQQMADAEDFHRARQPPRSFRRRHAARPQAERDVLGHGQMREQGVGLEHHRHAARGGRQMRDIAAGDFDPAATGGFQAGNDAQAGGLAAPGRPEQYGEAAGGDFQRDCVQRCHAAPLPADPGQPHGGTARGRRRNGEGRAADHCPVQSRTGAHAAHRLGVGRQTERTCCPL